MDVVALVDAVLGIADDVGPVLHEPSRAGLPTGLLVGGREQDQVAVERLAATFDGDHRHQIDCADPLAVERAAAVDEPALAGPGERRDAPAARIGRHDVEVREQDDRSRAAPPRQARVQAASPGRRLDHLRGDAFGGELPRERVGGGDLAAGRVRRVDAEHVGEQLRGLVAELPPVELDGIGRRREAAEHAGRDQQPSGFAGGAAHRAQMSQRRA